MKTVLGYTEDFTTCTCCGKSNLKGTYAVEVDGILNYFGSTCAFKKHGVSKAEIKVADSLHSTLKFHGVKTIEEYNAKQRAMCETANVWRASKGIPMITEAEILTYFIKAV